ncbi:hypothetical protein J2S43_001663 [Catenuloplanes nepalensis]|uniref:DUF4132 domain-containing protein n=1 Tax=Catenuloplanes nepalensis TaxID=587533 RepID=A0ABT9MP03_9ACTN|nr:DUF4132 domain-containing protein [Catenuloplanes nepalensis]MDP9793151.1 hypothetical protein [Catenuloplanes nepalensis]
MPTFTLPDEHAWELPAQWRESLHPRRGGTPHPPPPAPADPAAALRAHLEAEKPGRVLTQALERAVRYDPRLLAAGRRYLDRGGDDPDVRGAAVAALLTGGSVHRHAAVQLADLWMARFGAEFTARALGETIQLVATHALWAHDPDAEKTYDRMWRGEDRTALYVLARAVRSRLAVASAADYALACEILGGYRTTSVGRIMTSYVLPTQTAWVDEDCAAAAGWAADETKDEDGEHVAHHWLSALLLLAAGTPRHLAQLRGIHAYMLDYPPHTVVGTILDGVGPAAVPLLAEPFYLESLRLGDDWRQTRPGADLVRLLASIPTDEAFRLLCRTTLDETPLRPGWLLKSGALKRYPVRALRILAERETGAPSADTDILGTLLLAEPRLLPAAAPQLPPRARDRAAQIVADGGAGIGTGWAALLDRNGRYPRVLDTADDEKRVVGALAAVPTEEAFGLLIDRIDRKYVRPALLVAAKRQPRLALRALVARAAGNDTATALLHDHVLAYPEAVAAELPSLPEAGRALVRAHMPAPPATGPAAGDAPASLSAPLRRAPALPEWLVIPALPAVRVRAGGAALPPEAARRLCELLALSTIARPHPSLADAREDCEPRDLARFAWALFTQWQAAQYPAKTRLAMIALAHLGDDHVVPQLTALFGDWAAGGTMRVRTGLEVLATIGSDVALTALQRYARRVRTAGLRRFAEEALAAAAEARGVTLAQLSDRIVPDLGLDADGHVTLDYGPRRFTAGLDAQLQPWLADQRGARLTRLPRPAATDDATLAADAAHRWAELKKEAKTVVAERLRAMEDAMVTERRWSVADFRRLLVTHPLSGQITRRLLWIAEDADGTRTLVRVAEDRTFADVDDKLVPLDPAAGIGVAHPCHIAADRAAWASVFEDYAIGQPFPQLEREALTLADAGLDGIAGARVEGGRLFSLAARGWRFTDEHSALAHDWAGGLTTIVEFGPGYHWQDPDQPQHVRAVHIRSTAPVPEPAEDPARFADLGPVAASELARDLRFLTR